VKPNRIKICSSTLIILSITVFGIFAWLTHKAHLNYKSNSDTFRVDILEVKSQPNYFLERIRVKCLGDMKAGIWVGDLKKAGVFPSKGQTEKLFIEKAIHTKLGIQRKSALMKNSLLVRYFSLRILLQTVQPGTAKSRAGTCDTTFPSSLNVTEIQTNWPSFYQRGTDIPLANLGEYKISLSIK
jgi:hypothetical protein